MPAPRPVPDRLDRVARYIDEVLDSDNITPEQRLRLNVAHRMTTLIISEMTTPRHDPGPDTDGLITTRQVMTRLDISRATMARRTRNGLITPVRRDPIRGNLFNPATLPERHTR